MIESFIALASIFFGIVGANIMGYKFPKYSFGVTGNTIVGVFGGTLFIKSFGRLGFGPKNIMMYGEANYTLLVINILVSILGGAITLYLGKRLWFYINKKSENK